MKVLAPVCRGSSTTWEVVSWSQTWGSSREIERLSKPLPASRLPLARSWGFLAEWFAGAVGASATRKASLWVSPRSDTRFLGARIGLTMEALRAYYDMTDVAAVAGFLEGNEFLVPVLGEAPEKIREVFGFVRLDLEVFRDADSHMEKLFIVIKSTCTPNEAVECEERLVRTWFSEKMLQCRGKLNLAEEPA